MRDKPIADDSLVINTDHCSCGACGGVGYLRFIDKVERDGVAYAIVNILACSVCVGSGFKPCTCADTTKEAEVVVKQLESKRAHR